MSPTDLSELGAFIARHRGEHAMSLEALAQSTGVSRSTILRIERGEFGRPDPEKLQRIARALELPVEDLFALANYTPSDALPTVQPYLRAKFGDELGKDDLAAVERYLDRRRAKNRRGDDSAR